MLINSLYVIVCVIVLFVYVLSYTPGYLFGKFSALSFCVTPLFPAKASVFVP